MKRKECIIIATMVACVAVAVGCGVSPERRQQLLDLQAQNQADTVFRSDSLQRVLVRYFDRHGRSNERMLAHYLLGRALADMGEAPQAIEAYQQAIDCADTTSNDCDLYVLSAIYGQMAMLFNEQLLPEAFIEAQQHYVDLAWQRSDTIDALVGTQNIVKAYYLLGDTDKIIRTADYTSNLYRQFGYHDRAARALITETYIYVQRQQYKRAKECIDLIRRESGIFKADGSLRPGREGFYFTIGSYSDGINQLDSAEYYFRHSLSAQRYEEAYKGLLSVYTKHHIPDSIAKYAQLYADEVNKFCLSLHTDAVQRASALYNYNRHLQVARQQERLAKNRSYIIMALGLIVLLLLAAYVRVEQHKRRKERALTQVRAEMQSELNTRQEQYQLLLKDIQSQKQLFNYYASDIVQLVRDKAVFRETPLKAKEMKKLRSLFEEAFPHFCDFVQKQTNNFTDNEWNVCVLMDLGLQNSDMAFLLDATPQRIHGLMSQINNILFHSKGSSDLLVNFKRVLRRGKPII